ncbi:hypothetical protein [Rubrivivax rivuli]|nr:hypothetical protein [Rubrivivax rivuli]
MSEQALYLTDQCVFWLERARAGSVNAGRPSFWAAECRRVAAQLIGAGC